MSLASMLVTKRDGRTEILDLEKANKVLMWACDCIAGVSPSEVAMKASTRLFNGITTTDIHKSFIDASEELIHVDYRYAEVMSRLLMIDLLKRVYGDWRTIKSLSDIVKENSDRGLYDPTLHSMYSEQEWDQINSWIVHDRDYTFKGAGLKQFKDKYLAQNRSTKEVYETPQVAYMLCAAAGLAFLPKDIRMSSVHKQYNQLSKGRVSLPTPVLAGVRLKNKQFASCILIDIGDDLDSINDASTAANRYAAKRAGLGLNVGRIRPAKSKIGSGEVVSTGIVPFLKKYESSIKSCSQGGIRDASATVYIPVWHYEIEEVLVLKSAKTNEAKAVRRLDYGIQWDSYLLRRCVQKKSIILFSPNEVPDLYEAFFEKDRTRFESLYEKYEKDENLKFRKAVDGRDLYAKFLVESLETGRYYKFDADHVNTHTPFLEPIFMSNLCCEIALPTTPIRNIYSNFDISSMKGSVSFNGLVQLCILSAINLGDINLDDHKDMETRMESAVFFLNELIDHMDYTVPQSAKATEQYRPLGIGVVNYAYFLAKRNLGYGDQAALDLTHRLAEQMYYYGLKASCKYARIKGKPLPAFDKLIYSQGRTLLDTYNKRVDELTSQPLECDWVTLKSDIQKYGLYNSTLIALMPSESSSTVTNSTSAWDPVRSLITVKGNKKLKLTQVVPEPIKLKNQYDMLWDMGPEKFVGVIKTAAVFQKFTCQAISTNFSYNPDHYPQGKVPITVLMNHTQLAAKYGLKTRYYVNTKGEDADKVEKMMELEESKALQLEESNEDSEGCAGGACKI